MFDKDKIINHWIKSSDENFKAMQDFYKIKRFDWALFLGHLCLEKLLKSKYVKHNNQIPPYTHNLVLLAERNGFILDEEMRNNLDSISN